MVKRFAVLTAICFAAYTNVAHGASTGQTLVLAYAAMNARVAPLWVEAAADAPARVPHEPRMP